MLSLETLGGSKVKASTKAVTSSEAMTRTKVLNEIDKSEKESDLDQVTEADGILVKNRDGMRVVKMVDILFVERNNRQTVIVTRDDSYTISKSLQELEALLPKSEFIRSHKSYIVRMDAITSLSVYGRWTYVVKFKNTDKDALITKEKAKTFEASFGLMK